MSQSVKVKLWFKEDMGGKNHYLDLVFRNDDPITPQVNNWIKRNLKGVSRWEFIEEVVVDDRS